MSPQISLDQFEFWADGLDHPECVTCSSDGTTFAGGEAGQIYRIAPDGKPQEIASTGGFILGVCMDGNGNVYACDLKQNCVFRVTAAGQVTVYSRGTKERPMVTPNFPVFDADGNLYVSDSGHWKQDNGCVYRIRPGGETQVWSTAAGKFPNGLALSADGAHLYVVLSLMPGVVRMAIGPQGEAGDPEQVAALPETVPDGLAFDSAGDLFISCYTPDVIYRRTAAGELCEFARDPQHVTLSSPTNLAFCGPDRRSLVCASLGRWHLARTRVTVPGMPLNYPRF